MALLPRFFRCYLMTSPSARRSRLLTVPVALLLIIGLAGCAGGGGGGAAGGATPLSGTGSARQLGQRAVPGGMITVISSDAPIAGSSATFHLLVSGFAHQPTVVQARLGTTYEEGGALVSATPAGDGYDLTMPVPDIVSRVWVRLEFADGSMIESGAAASTLRQAGQGDAHGHAVFTA
jgi:hypothetical protein